jgi:hypothetical protein
VNPVRQRFIVTAFDSCSMKGLQCCRRDSTAMAALADSQRSMSNTRSWQCEGVCADERKLWSKGTAE